MSNERDVLRRAADIDPSAFDSALFFELGTGPAFDRRQRAIKKARDELEEATSNG